MLEIFLELIEVQDIHNKAVQVGNFQISSNLCSMFIRYARVLLLMQWILEVQIGLSCSYYKYLISDIFAICYLQY